MITAEKAKTHGKLVRDGERGGSKGGGGAAAAVNLIAFEGGTACGSVLPRPRDARVAGTRV
eukprot:3834885-Prymnesium_polylepis.1